MHDSGSADLDARPKREKAGVGMEEPGGDVWQPGGLDKGSRPGNDRNEHELDICDVDGGMDTESPLADAAVPGWEQDARLLQAMARGDVRAFESLYDRYAPQAYGLALRVSRSRQIAEESVQDAFLSIWQRAESFRPEKGTLSAYLLRIVHNRVVSAIRSEQAKRKRDVSMASLQEQTDDDALVDLAWAAVRRQHVRGTLELLSGAQREALELAYFGGLTHAEVADRLGIPLGTVKTRIRDGMIRLRSLLSRAGITEV
jgi:RNA polymerase sigma-70 factor (ECF subfamily)